MRFVRRPDRSRSLLSGMALACIAALALALWGQYRYDLQPCPWCILQRLVYLVMAAVCLVGAAVPLRAARLLAAAIAFVLALAGAASAVYQHVVAANSASCALTFADRFLMKLALDRTLPSVFEVRGSCADAAVAVFGVPFDVWSLALFALLGCAALLALRPR